MVCLNSNSKCIINSNRRHNEGNFNKRSLEKRQNKHVPAIMSGVASGQRVFMGNVVEGEMTYNFCVGRT